uniref:calmodulin-binding protein 60 B-like isoform X2 n=1 Tax=Erigeron canadensis TaxID=72917 RepID=UPI001CB96C24|nr:calmodulin-binding protein 60 B-like isoform X2 [Erigeron canadensis]
MVLKRPLGEAEEEGRRELLNRETRQRNHVSSNFARNVMHELSTQDFVSTLEPLIRRWVRDEVQRACQSFCCSSPRSPFNALEPCGTSTSLQLRFVTKMPQMLFTNSKVESEDNGAVKIVLFDTDSNKIVSSGPLSSSKVQIVPLDGDFTVDDDEDWSQKDFEAKVIYARDGKRPLVAGELMMVLNEGVGELGEIYFTDNSSWRRSRKFRLGAHVNSRVRIREARSEAFMVKDHRGESYKKHHPPYLVDDIWRLEKIAKDGAFHKRLGLERIRTVKDFLQMYVTNESSLRKILGGSCNKTWDTIIKHANDCILDDKLYMYSCGGEGIGLLFNSIFKIIGATFDGQNYLPMEKLAAFQKTVVESLKQQLYKNLDGMLPMVDMSVFEVPMLTSNLLGDAHRSGASLLLENGNIPALLQDQPQMQLASAPYMFGVDNSSQYIAEGSSMQLYNPRNQLMQKEFSGGPYGEGCSSSSVSGSQETDHPGEGGARFGQP